jgi:hypothetical protein
MSRRKVSILNAYASRAPRKWNFGRAYGVVPFTFTDNFSYGAAGSLPVVAPGRWTVFDSHGGVVPTDQPAILAGGGLTGPPAYTAGSSEKWLELSNSPLTMPDGYSVPLGMVWDYTAAWEISGAFTIGAAAFAGWAIVWGTLDTAAMTGAPYAQIDSAGNLISNGTWGFGGATSTPLGANTVGAHTMRVVFDPTAAVGVRYTYYVDGVQILQTVGGAPFHPGVGIYFQFNSAAGQTQKHAFTQLQLKGVTLPI